VTSLSVASSVPQAARPRRTLLLAGAVAAVVVAGLGLLFVARSVLGTPAASGASASASPAEAGPRMVHVRLEGVPVGALVTVDGQSLPAGITTVDGHPGERHAVRVVAQGFDALEFPIDFVDDQAMPLTMTSPRATASTPLAAASTRPVIRPPPVVTAHPTATGTATTKPTSGVDLGY
jgi:hypothetical protein